MNDEPRCPNHPDRKATMPTPQGKVCYDCFFKTREDKPPRRAVVVVKEEAK